MTYREIYSAAQSLVGETVNAESEDYEARAPYLLGSFYTEQIPLQKARDLARGEAAGTYPPCLCVDLDNPFPLSDEFIAPATYYLAAMLVIDENEEMSDGFFDHYVDAVASLQASLLAESKKIKDCYRALD